MKPEKPLGGRLAFLDWTRGLAAVIMLQGHAFHSFTSKELREGSAYVLSQFAGGIVPAIFLFLTGVTLAFLMDSRERQGVAPSGRLLAALRRSGYLIGLAFVIRFQMWLFARPYGHWTDLFKVDVLNCMGFGLALMSVMAIFPTRERARLCGILGFAIAFASPLISALDWSTVPQLLKDYIAPDSRYFSFFPWAAFLAFGLSFGSILRLFERDQLQRGLQWFTLAGIVLLFGSQYASNMPYSLYPKSEFWLDSPWLILMKLGSIFILISFAYLWTEYGSRGFSWVQQIGTTSLIVYWVHIELIYGRWFAGYKENLNVQDTVVMGILVTLLMLGLSIVSTRWRGWFGNSLSAFWNQLPKKLPASGD